MRRTDVIPGIFLCLTCAVSLLPVWACGGGTEGGATARNLILISI